MGYKYLTIREIIQASRFLDFPKITTTTTTTTNKTEELGHPDSLTLQDNNILEPMLAAEKGRREREKQATHWEPDMGLNPETVES